MEGGSHLKDIAERQVLPYVAEGCKVRRRAIGHGRFETMDQSVNVLLVCRHSQ